MKEDYPKYVSEETFNSLTIEFIALKHLFEEFEKSQRAKTDALMTELEQMAHIETGTFVWDWGFSKMDHRQVPQGKKFESKIVFKNKFHEVPLVFVALTKIDLHSTARAVVEAKKVTPECFTLSAGSWSDTKLFCLTVQWIAFEGGKFRSLHDLANISLSDFKSVP